MLPQSCNQASTTQRIQLCRSCSVPSNWVYSLCRIDPIRRQYTPSMPSSTSDYFHGIKPCERDTWTDLATRASGNVAKMMCALTVSKAWTCHLMMLKTRSQKLLLYFYSFDPPLSAFRPGRVQSLKDDPYSRSFFRAPRTHCQ